MTLRVEERDVAAHMGVWHDLLAQTRDTPVDPAALAWRYLQNPAGRARAWVLADDASGEIAGFTVVMPRRMRAAGRELKAWIGADFSILPRFRALGPALQLRRAAREAIDRGEADLLYSFPNQRMVMIHERVGHVRLGQLRRVALPVTLEPHIRRAAGGSPVVSVVAPAVSFAWRQWLRLQAGTARDRVHLANGVDPDDRFALLDPAAGTGRVAGVRDAAYLRWRYSGQPGWRGGLLVANRHGRPIGYLAFTEEAGLLQITDLVAGDEQAARSLIAHASALAARRAHGSVSSVGLGSGIWDPVFERMGFREREENYAVYAYVPERHAHWLSADQPAQWHLTVGDRDI